MALFVLTKNFIEGTHSWPGAAGDEHFLRHSHRHLFEIRCKAFVANPDRQIEIIAMQHRIATYLSERFGTPCEFGALSCESIAELLAEAFNFNEVTVLEDGISGGGYVRSNEDL